MASDSLWHMGGLNKPMTLVNRIFEVFTSRVIFHP